MRKLSQKLVSYLNLQSVLAYNFLVVLYCIISFVVVSIYDIEIGEEKLLFALKLGYILTSIATIVTSILMTVFRNRLNNLFDAIKAIADGEFKIIYEEKHQGKYGSAYGSLNRVIEELKGSKEEMENFTNEFLHEIKTPLTAIQGFSELLIETGQEIESPERMKYLRIILDESKRLTNLSQNTLLLAKMDACQIVTEKEEYDLGEQIKKCIILLIAQIDEKNIELDVNVENLVYYGNREFMEQVWINLINNAIKFSEIGGKITIKGISDEEGILLTFSDNGPGMDEETQQHIFEKFYQGTCGRKKGGNGIGLSIVHRVVKLCKGKIEVHSTLGEGTTFELFLPNKYVLSKRKDLKNQNIFFFTFVQPFNSIFIL